MAGSELIPLRIGQVGILVSNLDAAMEMYWKVLGIGPWKVFTNSAPPLKCLYHGKPSSYRVRVALAEAGPLVMELIQYLEGDTIHRDFVAAGRLGVEHLGIYVPSIDEVLDHLSERGIQVLQSADGLGAKGDGRYVYLDTEAIVGTVLELIQPPSERVLPQQIYPSE